MYYFKSEKLKQNRIDLHQIYTEYRHQETGKMRLRYALKHHRGLDAIAAAEATAAPRGR